jgi:hypothetical protein
LRHGPLFRDGLAYLFCEVGRSILSPVPIARVTLLVIALSYKKPPAPGDADYAPLAYVKGETGLFAVTLLSRGPFLRSGFT